MLKRILLIIVVLLSAGSLFSQSLSLVTPTDVSSFRNNALGGIINNDLDLIYDPVELNYVRNLHIYTNLSNLTSTHEQIFNNYTPGDNMFLFGISRENPLIPNLTHAVLFSFQKSQNPQPVYINPNLSNSFNYIAGSGYLENVFYNYYDVGATGTYSREEYVSQNKSSYDNLNGYKFVLNNSYAYNSLVFGLKFVASNSKQENNRNSSPLGLPVMRLSGTYPGDPSFQRDYLMLNLAQNSPIMHFKEEGDFNSYTETPLVFFDASASRKLINTDDRSVEVRADFMYSKYKNNSSTNDLYSGSYADYQPSVQNYLLNIAENAGYIYNTKEDGSWFGFSGESRYVFFKQPQRINEGFVSLKISYIHSSFVYSSNSLTTLASQDKEYNAPSGSYLHDGTNYTYNANSGDGNDNNCTILARTNMPLTDGVFVGFGFIYNYTSRDLGTRYSNQYNSVYKTSSLDAVYSPTLQSTQTVYSQSDENHSISSSVNQFIVPIGIEYKFTANQKWALRFGSIFSYTTFTYDYESQILSSVPQTTKVEYANGNSTVTVSPTSFNSSLSNQHTTSVSNTVFTYGIGYAPTENLQIDAIGFFEINNSVSLLEYVKSLRLSFVLKW